MSSEIISMYATKSGEIAMSLKKFTTVSGRVSYSYNGKFGAGCTSNYTDAVERVKNSLSRRRVIHASGIDIR